MVHVELGVDSRCVVDLDRWETDDLVPVELHDRGEDGGLGGTQSVIRSGVSGHATLDC